MSNEQLSHRYLALIRVEADSALALGTGQESVQADNTFTRDAFGIPYLPGTGLAGALRASLAQFGLMTAEQVDLIFGFGKTKEAQHTVPIQGSRLIVSPAHLFINKTVADGQEQIEELHGQIAEEVLPYLVHRDHVRINHRGVADSDEHGKFENEYLPKGLQFVFELELWGKAEDKENWEKLLQALRHPLFRIGGGTRKGFGKLRVRDIDETCYDLRTNQLEDYLKRPSSLQWNKKEEDDLPKLQTDSFKPYKINLQPRDFFLFDGQFDLEFSGGNNQKRPDFAPKREYVLKYDKTTGTYNKAYRYLIPATSIKGILAHRFAYHYNKNTNNFVALDAEALQKRQEEFLTELEALHQKELDSLQHKSLEELQALEQKLAEKSETIRAIEAQIKALQDGSESALISESLHKSNLAVQTLFGEALDSQNGKGQRGRLIIEDIYLSDKELTKVFNHVKIDRFTGGAVDTALFTEKVLTQKSTFTLTMHLEQGALDGDEHLANAWEMTLKDLKEGRLPLGGGVMRGHGMMKENKQPQPNA